MSIGGNKATLRRAFEEGLNQGKVAIYDELCAPTFIHHDPTFFTVRTREAYKRWVTEMRNAFPDLHFTLEDVIAEGEQVVARWLMRGTHTGDMVLTQAYFPATGKRFTTRGITIVRFVEGKIAEDWQQGDHLGLFEQLGLIVVSQPVGIRT